MFCTITSHSVQHHGLFRSKLKLVNIRALHESLHTFTTEPSRISGRYPSSWRHSRWLSRSRDARSYTAGNMRVPTHRCQTVARDLHSQTTSIVTHTTRHTKTFCLDVCMNISQLYSIIMIFQIANSTTASGFRSGHLIQTESADNVNLPRTPANYQLRHQFIAFVCIECYAAIVDNTLFGRIRICTTVISYLRV